MLSEDPIFQDYTSNQTVNFNSTWNSVKVKSDSGIQTDQIFTKDSVSQSQTYSTQSVQTLPEKPFPTWPLEKYDRSALAVFISSVEPMISSTLLQNIKSNAFDDYTVEWQDEINEISCILNLEQKRREIDTICTQVSWSKSGSVVAAAYGRFDHESCCTHKGVLATWNVYLDSDIIAFSTDSCLLSIAFHPDIHSLIVGGTFNGEVIVWQTNDPDNPIFAISKTSEISHQEPIAKVSWIPSKSAGMWDILSLGTDGKIIIWTLEPKTITPTYGTQLMVSHITRISSSDDSKLGATSFAYSMETKSIIVGTECGAILQCNLSNISPFKTKNDSIKTNPVTLLFSPPHTGPVQYISCSSLSKSLFQSCGGDGQLRIYRNSKDPLLILEPSLKPLYSCDWSRTKSTVFAVSAADGFFYIYDLSINENTPVASIQAAESGNTVITCVQFNLNRPEFLVTGDSEGRLKIWRLSTKLVNGSAVDDEKMNSLT